MNLFKIGVVLMGIFSAMTASQGLAQEKAVGIARVFEHDSGARLYVAPYGRSTDNTYLVLFENFNDPWDGKVILHHFLDSAVHDKYEISVPTGKKLRPYKKYVSIVDSGHKTLSNGSAVAVIEVHVTSKKEALRMRQSATDKEISNRMLHLYNTQTFEVKF